MGSLRTFHLFLCTQIFSLIGSRMSGFAVSIYVFAETGNATPLLLAAFFAELPSMAGGTFTGFLADRFDRRLVIMLGDLGQALATGALLFSFATDAFVLWHLYGAMLVQGIFLTLQAPASEATITMLVPQSARDRANGLKAMGFPLAGIIAPVLAGTLYGIVEVVGVMVFDLFTFAVALVVIALIHIPRPLKSQESYHLEKNFWRDMLGGWHFIVERRALLILIIYLALIYFLINGPLEIAVPYTIALTNSEQLAGFIFGAMSLGAFCGAFLVVIIGRFPRRIDVIFGGYFWHGFFLIIYGMVRHPLLLGASLFGTMIPLPLTGALFNTVLQNKTPPDIQGRVFAICGQLFTLTTPFSFLLTAFLVDKFLEPAVGQSGWQVVAPLVGTQDGSGMGLLMVIIGMLICLCTIFVYQIEDIRRLEKHLPDYEVMGKEIEVSPQRESATSGQVNPSAQFLEEFTNGAS